MASRVNENCGTMRAQEIEEFKEVEKKRLDTNYKIAKVVLVLLLLVGTALMAASLSPSAITLASKLFPVGSAITVSSIFLWFIAKYKYDVAIQNNYMNALISSADVI
jgi:hypothetical protein